jgi:hypothetical protein
MRNRSLSVLLLFALIAGCLGICVAQSAPSAVPPAYIPPTEISANLGSCSALITVTGADAKPVFNARVSTRIHYGFLSVKKLDLEVFTSAAGQVKIVGLPEVPKKTIIFYINKDGRMDSVEYTPEVKCRGTYNVQLK